MDTYHVTDGRNERSFPFTPEGLKQAWQFSKTLRTFQLTNPNRVDLRADDSGLDDGITEADQDTFDGFDAQCDEAVLEALKSGGYDDAADAACEFLGVKGITSAVTDVLESASRSLQDEEGAAEDAYWESRIDEARGK